MPHDGKNILTNLYAKGAVKSPTVAVRAVDDWALTPGLPSVFRDSWHQKYAAVLWEIGFQNAV